MSYIDATDDLSALLTDGGRAALASMVLGEVVFDLTTFQVGRGGYVVGNPVRISPIDTTDTALTDPVGAHRAFTIIEQPISPSTVAPVCRLGLAESDVEYGLGELGIFATYRYHHSVPSLVGTEFLFALAHFPLVSKTASHVLVWRVVIAL